MLCKAPNNRRVDHRDRKKGEVFDVRDDMARRLIDAGILVTPETPLEQKVEKPASIKKAPAKKAPAKKASRRKSASK